MDHRSITIDLSHPTNQNPEQEQEVPTDFNEIEFAQAELIPRLKEVHELCAARNIPLFIYLETAHKNDTTTCLRSCVAPENRSQKAHFCGRFVADDSNFQKVLGMLEPFFFLFQ